MVNNSKEIVTNVVSSMVDARSVDFHELQTEFETSSREIGNLIESWKRKIIEVGSITDYKRAKIENGTSKQSTESKENVHPNLNSVIDLESQKENSYPVKDEDEEELDVNSMKVAELRKHLKKRMLDDQGLKKTLQLRLQKYLDDEKEQKQRAVTTVDPEHGEAADNIVKVEQIVPDDQAISDDVDKASYESVHNEETDLEMTEPTSSEKNIEHTNSSPDMSCETSDDISMSVDTSSVQNSMESEKMEEIKEDEEPEPDVESEKMEEIEEDEEPEPDVGDIDEIQAIDDAPKISCGKTAKSPKKKLGKKFLKATSKLFSPNKTNKSPKKKMKIVEDRQEAEDNKVSQVVDQALKVPDEENRADQRLDVMVEKESITDLNDSKNNMIEKARTTVSTVASMDESSFEPKEPQPMLTPAVPTKNAGKTFSSSTAQTKKREIDEARKARLEKIRNKVYKNQESAIKPHPVNAMKKSNNSTSSQDSAEDRKKAFAAKMRQKLAAKTNEVVATPIQQHLTPSSHQLKSAKVLSPMDTYELSDHDDSDSCSSEDEYDDKSSKKIPKWAQRENLIRALERQFIDGPAKLDPDKIFPEVSTCNLEDIFGQRKKKYVKRASTGDWRADKVTMAEKIVYKRNMGFK